MDDSCTPAAHATSASHSLFQVYLRLRPPTAGATASCAERFINVEPPAVDALSTAPTHITLNPPNDRRRPIEKFAFTQVFEEDATQLDVFHCTNVVSLVEGVLAPHGGDGNDALLATLGVTGSGKVLPPVTRRARGRSVTGILAASPRLVLYNALTRLHQYSLTLYSALGRSVA